MALLQSTLQAAALSQPSEERPIALSEVEVATIDAYQGREAEAVVVSLVRFSTCLQLSACHHSLMTPDDP